MHDFFHDDARKSAKILLLVVSFIYGALCIGVISIKTLMSISQVVGRIIIVLRVSSDTIGNLVQHR